MTGRQNFKVAALTAGVHPRRQLSQELCNFLLSGQPGVAPEEMLGKEEISFLDQGPFGGNESTRPDHIVTSEDLLNLTHARPNLLPFWFSRGFRTHTEDAYSIYSFQLAELLPAGHPYRRFHGIEDSEEEIIRWTLADPDLSEGDRKLIEETLLEADPMKRATRWPLLVRAVQDETWGWHGIRFMLFTSLYGVGERFLDQLHPREAGVLRSIGNEATVEQIAERFGVDTKRIVLIQAEASEKVRTEFSDEVASLQDYIDSSGIVAISNLAGLVKDLPTEKRGHFTFTRILLQFCSARSIRDASGETYLLSNSAYTQAKPL